MKQPSPPPSTRTSDGPSAELTESIRFAKLLQEKCELKEANEAWLRSFEGARHLADPTLAIECLQGLLRLAAEALDLPGIQRWERELEAMLAALPGGEPPPMVWSAKGSVALRCGDYPLAQRHYHSALRALRRGRSKENGLDYDLARAWYSMAYALFERGRLKRAQFLVTTLIRVAKAQDVSKILGFCYQLLGRISERRREFEAAHRFHQEAQAAFLIEHDWYSHLTVLLAYARIARQQRNYVQAYWYLDLLDKAAPGSEFGSIRKEVLIERSRLEQDAVDLLIDSRRAVVQTRDSGQVSLGKQYVLLNILEALSDAHDDEDTSSAGLSKAELIERVWQERYRPEAHDNKLYYNINRLRKLIEPDMKKPKYLLNWREGYRLAPGLRVQRVGV